MAKGLYLLIFITKNKTKITQYTSVFKSLFGYFTARIIICNNSFDFAGISLGSQTCFYSPSLSSDFSSPHLMALGNSNFFSSAIPPCCRTIQLSLAPVPKFIKKSTFVHLKSFEILDPQHSFFFKCSYQRLTYLKKQSFKIERFSFDTYKMFIPFLKNWVLHADILNLIHDTLKYRYQGSHLKERKQGLPWWLSG